MSEGVVPLHTGPGGPWGGDVLESAQGPGAAPRLTES